MRIRVSTRRRAREDLGADDRFGPEAGTMRVASLALLIALSPAAASAQAVDLTRPDPIADELTDVRLSLHAERREAGIALFAGGLLSVVAGAVIAGVEHDDPFWLSFGVGTLGWGAINAALAIGMLDLGDGGARSIEADRAVRGEALARARERALRQQHGAATVFALNAGLDVAYVLSGILLFFVADQLDAESDAAALRGYAIAQLGQGGFLLVFDLVEWIASSARADRVAAIPSVRW